MDKNSNNDNHQYDNKESLKNFLLDIDCLDALKPWTSKVNIFDILKIQRAEIRHSNILSWLLDANENHGLGELFIKAVIQILVKNNLNYFTFRDINVLELLSLDFSNFMVMREWNHTDILLSSQEDKVVICIENKMNIGDHSKQLDDYRQKIQKIFPKEKGYDVIYVYLTPENDLSSDTDTWVPFSYNEVLDILNNIIDSRELQARVKFIIENYIEIIRGYIVKDRGLEETCINIYKKHKQALDLIFDNRPDFGNIIADIVKEYLSNREETSKDIIYIPAYSTKVYQRFFTDFFNKILPPVTDERRTQRHWGNDINYVFEIKNIYSQNKLYLRFIMCNYDEWNGGKAKKLSKLLNEELGFTWQLKTFYSDTIELKKLDMFEGYLENNYNDLKKDIFTRLDKAMEGVLEFENKVKKLWADKS